MILVLCAIAQTVGCFLVVPASETAHADNSQLQSQIDSDAQQIAALNQKIAEYEAQLNKIGADKRTLQNAIYSLDLQRNKIQAQMQLTQAQINTTQTQIQELGNDIDATKARILENQQAIAMDIQQIQQNDQQPAILQMVASGSFSQFWENVDQTSQVQAALQDKVNSLQDEEKTLADNQSAVQQKQDDLNSQKQTLVAQQTSLSATVRSKNDLLAQTNSKESQYQKLLAQAEAELNSYSNFTKNAGGSGLLSHQTVCDDWGCYYNQRDAAWGAMPLDGTQYSLASDGCLITSMAMVMTHYGYKDVTPVTINSNPTNFASYYPAYLLYTINADGVTATRKSASIDSTLASGNPVVVGMHVYGGTHFVVLVSGSNGHYIMRDPYLSNAKDISFNAHYNLGEVYSIARVVIN